MRRCKGTVTFRKDTKDGAEEYNTGVFIGMEFYPMLFQPWDSGMGVECAEGSWRGCGGCCEIWMITL